MENEDIIEFFNMYSPMFEFLNKIRNTSEYEDNLEVETNVEFAYHLETVYRIELYMRIYFYPPVDDLPTNEKGEIENFSNTGTDIFIFHDFEKHTGKESILLEIEHVIDGERNDKYKLPITDHYIKDITKDNKKEISQVILQSLQEVEKLFLEKQ